MSELQQRCVYCHLSYRPDPRAATRQKSCGAPACRLRRKEEAQRKFLNKNPDYFRGRYSQTKTWLAAHPGYLAAYRATHPEYREKNRRRERRRRRHRRACRVDIQVTRLRRSIGALWGLRGVDIQDTIGRRLDGLLRLLGKAPGVDMQVTSDTHVSTG